jgi:hypothetical protein
MSLLTTYCQNGLCLVAIPKGMKGPITSGWNLRENVITSVDQLHLLHDSNIGLGHSYSSPYPTCAIDFDDLIKAKNWFQDKGVEINHYINADDAVHIISGKFNRLKLLFRLKTEPLRSQVIKDGSQTILEFRCATSNGLTVQDVLPPSIHPETQLPYTWGGKGHYSQIPFIPEDILTLWQSLLAPKMQETKPMISSLPESPKNIAILLGALDKISSDCDYETYRNIVWAIKSTAWSVANDVALVWSQKTLDRFSEETFNNLLNSYSYDNQNPITVGTIFHLAKMGVQHE